MNQQSFDFERFIGMRSAGRQNLVAAMRDMTAKATAGEIDASCLSDEAFLEPRLFAWHFGASRDTTTIMQMLFGALYGRHSSCLQVKTDGSGSVVLAGVGTLLTDVPDAELQLTCNAGGQPIYLAAHERTVQFKEVPRLLVPGTKIELIERADPVVQAFFSEYIDQSRPLELVQTPANYLPQIEKALRLIQVSAPGLHSALVTSVRSIVLFHHPTANSFAALQVHGMIFLNLNLNLRRPANTVFFVDGLVHQGGHVVFSEATLNRQVYFKVHPDSKMEEIIGQQDTRSVYEALHGLYTEYALVDVMDRARAASKFSRQQAVELQARTGFNLGRLGADLRRLTPHVDQVFSSLGMNLFTHFKHAHDEVSNRCRLAMPVYCEGQGDEFDIDMFLRKNRTMEL